MEQIVISKQKLLDKLRENRNNHRKIFEEALEGWRKRVIIELQCALRDARKGLKYRTYFNLPQPTDHTNEYDRIIDQIEWCETELIQLDQIQFNQFVRDDWGWKNDFLTNATIYNAKIS